LGADCHGEKLDYVLAAIAAAWALGMSPALIRAGIETFSVMQADVEFDITRKTV
jgi:UDP-N-acetylmuramyl pentapeptide synthase